MSSGSDDDFWPVAKKIGVSNKSPPFSPSESDGEIPDVIDISPSKPSSSKAAKGKKKEVPTFRVSSSEGLGKFIPAAKR